MEAKRCAHIWNLFQCKSIPDNAVTMWSPDDLGVVTWFDTPANEWTSRPGLCPDISDQFVSTKTKQFDRYATTKEWWTLIKLSVTLMCHLACFVETGDQTCVWKQLKQGVVRCQCQWCHLDELYLIGKAIICCCDVLIGFWTLDNFVTHHAVCQSKTSNSATL